VKGTFFSLFMSTSLGEKPGFSTTFQLHFEVENVTSNCNLKKKLKMTFSIAYQNSQQCWVEPTTQSKPSYTCQFFNQHWGDKILVESNKLF
jgi:hypothetical protein